METLKAAVNMEDIGEPDDGAEPSIH